MAILYTLEKTLDEFVIEVSQITAYELRYISDNSDSLVEAKTLAIDTPITLTATKDGEYELTLIAEGETNVIRVFNVIKYLQNSIILETLNILCGEDLRGCNDAFTTACLTAAGKECLTHKAIFVKLLTFQTLYVPTYGTSYSLIFSNFLEEGANTYGCKLQTTINNILLQECVTGSVKDVKSLFRLYVALYWAGMYFIEENLATGDNTELAFIKTKFMYDCIVPCLCNLCIDINGLKEVFTVDPNIAKITSFQFDGTAYDITDVNLLTPAYLLLNGEIHEEVDILAGKNITFNSLGRLGFVISNITPGTYLIYDILGNDITTTVFDVVYDTQSLTETFVSKEYYVPSTIYFKFIKQ